MKLAHKIALFAAAIIATGSVVAETRVDNGIDSTFRIAQPSQVVSETFSVAHDGTFHGQSQSGMIFFTVDSPARLTYTNSAQESVTLTASAPLTIASITEPARVASR